MLLKPTRENRSYSYPYKFENKSIRFNIEVNKKKQILCVVRICKMETTHVGI